jgi:hypothetical protein
VPAAVREEVALDCGEERTQRACCASRLGCELQRHPRASSLLIFGFGHVTNGWANVALALALGEVLTAIYLWRRDLIANRIGNFMIDLISVLVPRFLSHS